MRIQNKLCNRFSMWQVLLFLLVWEALILFVFTEMMCTEKNTAILILIGTVHQVMWIIMLAMGLRGLQTVTISREGVRRRIFLKEEVYAWEEICQVGCALFTPMRGIREPALVLVPEKEGIRRTRWDDGDENFSFQGNSFRRNIVIWHTPEAEQWIRDCYGPLDFVLQEENDG